MSVFRSGSFSLAIVLLLAACSPEPKVVKRYGDVTYKEASKDDPTPSVSFFSLPVPSEDARKTVFNLSDQGQAALLSGLANATNTPEELLSAASAKLETAAAKPGDIDLTRFKRRVVFTVERGSRRPADRLEWLKMELAIENSGFEFVSWNKATTAYETIDLGELKISQGRSAKIKSSLKPGSVGVLESIGAEVSNSENLEENQDQRRRIIDLNVSLPDDRHAAIVRQGAIDRDLDGNTVVDFEIKYREKVNTTALLKFHNLHKSNGEPISAKEIRMFLYEASYPMEAENVVASVTMEYDFRRVAKGDNTINEGDDSVVMISGRIDGSQSRALVSKSDQELEIWRLARESNSFVSFEPESPTACRRPNENTRLEFLTQDDALDFYWWLYLYQPSTGPEDHVVITPAHLALCLESGATDIESLRWGDIRRLYTSVHPLNYRSH